MRHADVSRDSSERMIVRLIRLLGRVLGLYHPVQPVPAAPDQPSKTAEGHAAEAKLRFKRALLMLDLAVAHARHGCPDTARTILNAAWAGLRNNPAARIQHRATAALVLALGGNVRQAVTCLTQAIDDYERTPVSPLVQQRINQLFIDTMEQLPHSRSINQLVRNAYSAREKGDYVTALRLLDQADQAYARHARLTPPRINGSRLDAWHAVLQDMHRRGGNSTRTILDALRAQQATPAASFMTAAA